MAGQTTTCPHCNLPTILFVPPTAKPPPVKKKMSAVKQLAFVASVCLAGILVVVATVGYEMVFGQVDPNGRSKTGDSNPNLKPANGAFGYVLGTQGQSVNLEEIEDETMLPFKTVSVETTPDGRIGRINAMGSISSDESYDTKKRLFSVLTEKYGLRGKNGIDGSYNFGTTDRTASLSIIHNDDGTDLFTIDYYDRELSDIIFQKMEDEQKNEDAKKKENLSKGL